MPSLPPDDAAPGEPRALVAALREENAQLREAVEARDAQLEAARAQVAVLTGRVAELERRLGKDSSTSSKPPSSDSPYTKKPRDRSLRRRSGRKPGKQPSSPSSALRQSPDPDERVECWPAACACCGTDLSDAPVTGVVRRQVFEAQPPPPPEVTEYQVIAKACPACGETTEGVAPVEATSLVQYGPEVHAKAALAVCAHYLPVARAAKLVAAFTGVQVSAGFMAGIRGKAAGRLGPFMDRARDLLRSAGVLYADETPARADGHLHYVHVACTEFLTALHTGGRSAEDIDAGRVLPGYTGTIVRDGYAGYAHLTSAVHAWCGAHGLRDLAGLYRFDPDGQVWARSMADLLIWANKQATAARAAGQASLSDGQLAEIRSWYRGAVAKGITGNSRRRSQIAKDGLRLARRFRDHQDMILRFATDLAVGFTSNEAERGVRPVKVQQRTSGGCWRTLQGLADFAVVQSYLLWLSWTARLCPLHGARIKIMRPALSAALLLVGTRLALADAAYLLGPATGSLDISKTLQVLHARRQWPGIATALTRLAGYLDAHHPPVDYQQRRQLDYHRLLPAAQWRRLCRQAQAPRHLDGYGHAARCVLFEQLSGTPAHLAPFGAAARTPPFRAKMGQLAAVLTPGLARGLQQTAASFLASHGITSEPITWDPPLHLLDGLNLPGADPRDIDLEHLHQLIRRDHVTLATAARHLGITSEAVQMLLHHHPAPPVSTEARADTRPSREILPRDLLARQYLAEHQSLAQIGKQAGLSANSTAWLARDYGIPIRGQKDYTAHQHPVLTRDWLWHQHVTCSRSLQDLATETGLSKSTIRRWAKLYEIPRQRRYPIRMNTTAAAAAAPPLLRPAITGPGAWKRLNRLAAASRYPSLSHAATGLGIHHTALIIQVKRLEREFGQQLLERAPGQQAMRPTTYGKKIIAAVRAAE